MDVGAYFQYFANFVFFGLFCRFACFIDFLIFRNLLVVYFGRRTGIAVLSDFFFAGL